MRDARIVIEIDYEPMLDGSSYPAGVKDKLDAMKADVEAYEDGTFGLSDLITFGDADVRVEAR